ncbi:BPL-N domain-containing protein [Aeoliella mucimassa]|uniref:Glutamine amidotransferase subunit PdxT n=1 Tax=Aeoliella mucimassa TaxID=2527972 RepID=A0A518ATM9_9BACT|nr:BPL-N domain-containing protein [Aeoliella mucimassa]QDU58084.1 Glutamine amidotransferase subunit PdxT [Aeoliella mucimassa]
MHLRLPCPARALLLLLSALLAPVGSACTTAVVSGRATEDGRPILWKNRDYIASPRNEVAILSGGRYRAVAVVNAGKRTSAWMGTNEAGLCIENSLSNDLKVDQKSQGLRNGGFNREVLLTCATVDDVQALLERTNQTGRQTTGNFGVIDAQGGAALFEVGPNSYTMFDANDPQVAPQGFLIRTNFATTAHQLPANPSAEAAADLYSGKRYQRASTLLATCANGRLSVPYFIQHLTRDLANEAGDPLVGSVNGRQGQLPAIIDTKSTISRTGTVSAAVFHGVRPGENARLTTMWVMLGDPKFSVAVPCFAGMTAVADPLQGDRGAELGEVARTLRDISHTRRTDRFRTELLPGIWNDILPLESKHLEQTITTREGWLVEPTSTDALNELHSQVANECYQALTRERDQAKTTLVAGKATTLDSTLAPQTTKVAIYDHSDGSANGPNHLLQFLTTDAGFVAERVGPEQIRQGQLQNYDVLIVPGGSASSQSKHLQQEGRDEIRHFVESGGGYVGICAGSYLASTHYSWSLGILNARVWDRVHWARGTGSVELSLSESGQSTLGSDDPVVQVHYAQGPLLVRGREADLPTYEVLATYQTEVAKKGALPGAMEGTHAIVRSTFGEGRVICYSPHPEVESGPNYLMASGVKWAAGE